MLSKYKKLLESNYGIIIDDTDAEFNLNLKKRLIKENKILKENSYSYVRNKLVIKYIELLESKAYRVDPKTGSTVEYVLPDDAGERPDLYWQNDQNKTFDSPLTDDQGNPIIQNASANQYATNSEKQEGLTPSELYIAAEPIITGMAQQVSQNPQSGPVTVVQGNSTPSQGNKNSPTIQIIINTNESKGADMSKDNLKKLLESEMEKAELVFAVKDVVDQLQKMAADLSKMGVETILPIIEKVKAEHGIDTAKSIETEITTALTSALEAVKNAKDITDNQSLKLSGDAPHSDLESAAPETQEEVPSVDSDVKMDVPPADSEIDLSNAEEGPVDEPLGRAQKESFINKKKMVEKKWLTKPILESILAEKSPPGMGDWVKKIKPKFINEYGKKKGTQVAYATAWKQYNESAKQKKKLSKEDEKQEKEFDRQTRYLKNIHVKKK